jgi:hypothetical protein
MVLMAEEKIAMRVCFTRKRISLSRSAVRSLGNPTHLGFLYDEINRNLAFLPASKDDMDAYEIPAYFWKSTRQSCEIVRTTFFRALQYRIGWEEGSRYTYNGVLESMDGIPSVVFNLTDGIKLNKRPAL